MSQENNESVNIDRAGEEKEQIVVRSLWDISRARAFFLSRDFYTEFGDDIPQLLDDPDRDDDDLGSGYTIDEDEAIELGYI